MYGENRFNDAIRLIRCAATNILAGLAPRLYVRLTRQTGRDHPDLETIDGIADYFQRCFEDYFKVLKINLDTVDAYLDGKRLLEYGPGDMPGVALLMIAHGAKSVVCVDRFALYAQSEKAIAVFNEILNRLQGNLRKRADVCFKVHGNPASGFDPAKISYLIRSDGLSGLNHEIDWVYSRAVLEHVNDLTATFVDMRNALKDQGLAVHQVDLRSHGLHQRNILDFLTWPSLLWSIMFSSKGVPNRWRVDAYKRAISNAGLEITLLEPIERASDSEVQEVLTHLAQPFRSISAQELSWLNFWLVCRRH